jgi:hypothetical protein
VTPATPTPPPNPSALLVLMFWGWVLYLLVITPLIVLGWNLGLQPAGIVDESIGWMTGVGLAFCTVIVRSIMPARL